MDELIPFNEDGLREEAASMRSLKSMREWRVVDAWLADMEAESVEGILNHADQSRTDRLRGRIEAIRYLRRLPDIVLKAAQDAPQPQADSAEDAPSATAD